ncbi:Glyoxalase/bleomycin resistance protein/dioxygenase [Legionella busanensis]|uniref:Glyoxalase/bleomycin resistance protein/dioxygenase n=1 Tax=Legionella busanensis TaxID=190655 RepID=A0A378JM79_9GAMM|nr:VOC family protein [Legionella busanensis]STX52187.1 Glyoxalase/bleomycin resistance protein/dioxygenase [Legionella busanensis]
MGIQLNHTIIQAKDAKTSATFLAEILGLPAPSIFGPFFVVKTSNQVSLDFKSTTDEKIQSRHFAFLVSELEFDEIFNRIIQRQLNYWADPTQSKGQQINHNDGGRGCYFLDPDGHLLEIITRPYGSFK